MSSAAAPEHIPRVRIGRSSISGRGLFTETEIPSGAQVVRYEGERIDKRESLRRCQLNNCDIFYLDEHWDLDGSSPSNLARYINHSCVPNCSAQWDAGEIWIVAERRILAGEELSFDYGYDLEDYRDYPCSCGAATCRRYIIAAELCGAGVPPAE